MAIGDGWTDGAWVDAGWIDGAWYAAGGGGGGEETEIRFRGALVRRRLSWGLALVLIFLTGCFYG